MNCTKESTNGNQLQMLRGGASQPLEKSGVLTGFSTWAASWRPWDLPGDGEPQEHNGDQCVYPSQGAVWVLVLLLDSGSLASCMSPGDGLHSIRSGEGGETQRDWCEDLVW